MLAHTNGFYLKVQIMPSTYCFYKNLCVLTWVSWIKNVTDITGHAQNGNVWCTWQHSMLSHSTPNVFHMYLSACAYIANNVYSMCDGDD